MGPRSVTKPDSITMVQGFACKRLPFSSTHNRDALFWQAFRDPSTTQVYDDDKETPPGGPACPIPSMMVILSPDSHSQPK